MRDLEWFGLDWDNQPVYQSERTEFYREMFDRLTERGLLYPCYCTRSERMAATAPHRDDGAVVYSGKCFSLTERERAALERQGRRPAWRGRCPPPGRSKKNVSFYVMHRANALLAWPSSPSCRAKAAILGAASANAASE